VLVVVQRGQRRRLAQPVHVVGGPHAVEPVDRLRTADGVADAQPGQRGHLRERAQHHQAREPGEQLDPVRVVGIVAEVPVGLVEHHQRLVVAERLEQAQQRRPPHDRRRRVVGRAEDHGLRARRHAPAHVVQVGLVAGQRAAADPGPGQGGRRAVGLERGDGHDHLVARIEGGQRDEPDQLVGAVADDDLRGRDPQPAGQRLAQGEAAAVGIEVHAVGLAADGVDHPGGRPQGVLVRRQADQLGEAQLGCQRLQGLAGIVGRDAVEDRSPQASQRGGSFVGGGGRRSRRLTLSPVPERIKRARAVI
jgi:hypothetical protein